MMNANHILAALGVGIVMVVGCGADEPASDENVGVATAAVDSCTGSAYGKWRKMANLAVATAEEMGELNTSAQFTVATDSVYGSYLALSSYGTSVCASKTDGCPMVEALLDLQLVDNDALAPQADFNPTDYRNTLVTSYQNEVNQINSYLMNISSQYTNLPEDHSLTSLGEQGTATCGSPWYAFQATRDFHLVFSSSGAVSGRYCTQLTEPNDSNGWSNNYLCSTRDIGLRWSNSGAISGMTCVSFNDPSDGDGWSNNYLCTYDNWGFSFSSSGTVSGKKCLAINEPNDSAWSNNYLCWDDTAALNHPSSLCTELMTFGGASYCNGSNPYIDFAIPDSTSSVTRFKIDPTDYGSSTSTTTQGICISTLPYVSTASSSSIIGRCCYVPSTGLYGVLKKYPTRAYYYYCYTAG